MGRNLSPENATDNFFKLRRCGPQEAHSWALKTYNAKHYDAIHSEMKSKVTWSSLMNQVYKYQSPLVSHLILSRWHHHPSCCANSEPNGHPGHSPSITNLPINLVHFSSMVSNSFHLLCSKPPLPLGRIASVISQLVSSHPLWSPSNLVSAQQAEWMSKTHQNHLPHYTFT